MIEVAEGTLDAHPRLDLATMFPADAVQGHFDGEVAQQVSPRTNWRVAIMPDGEPVGFVTPGHNHYNPMIGYLAVLPSHRGQGSYRRPPQRGGARTGLQRCRARAGGHRPDQHPDGCSVRTRRLVDVRARHHDGQVRFRIRLPLTARHDRRRVRDRSQVRGHRYCRCRRLTRCPWWCSHRSGSRRAD